MISALLLVSDSISHDGDTNTKIRFPGIAINLEVDVLSERYLISGGNIYNGERKCRWCCNATSFSGDGSSLTGTGNTSNVRTGIFRCRWYCNI